MTPFPAEAYEKLGFDEVRRRLAALCHSPEAAEYCSQLQPFAQPVDQDLFRTRCGEIIHLLQKGQRMPLGELAHIQPLLAQLAIDGAYLTELELGTMRSFLYTANGLVRFLQDTEQCPTLATLLHEHPADSALYGLIDSLLGPDNRLKDTASPDLARLRRSLREVGGQLRSQLNKLLNEAKRRGHLDPNAEITIRNDRLVLPVPSEHKNKYEGFVQDVSATGQTFFVEPAAALPLNNRQRELGMQEHNEVLRILHDISYRLRQHLPTLRSMLGLVRKLDHLHAAARLGIAYEGTAQYRVQPGLPWQVVQARHPLLCLHKGVDAVVPFALRLDAEHRILLISGPNAGGKSVTLKAVGLLQLMGQCGLPLPIEVGSTLPWLHKLFVNLGDDQNLQSDLSTYTSHLTQMRVALDNLDDRSLLLIDEFGTGTDPALGGPIAEALLERFVAAGCLGVINTHYSNLKEYAHRTAGIQNAALAFDLAQLAPTYRLLVGQPGSSYALEIARRVGLPENLLQRATQLAGQERGDTEQLLTQLRQQHLELQQLKEYHATQAAGLEKERKDYIELQKLATKQKKEILDMAKKQADQMVREANARIEETIRKIKEAQAEKDLTRQVRQELKEAFLLEETPKEKKRKPVPQAIAAPVAVGATVLLDDGTTPGTVLELDADEAMVAFGQLQMRVDTARLKVVAAGKGQQVTVRTLGVRAQNPGLQLDLRGQRVDAALAELDTYMDKLTLSGYHKAEILHGKGSGALRDAIRQHLRKQYPAIRLQDAPPEQGGAGITRIDLLPDS